MEPKVIFPLSDPDVQKFLHDWFIMGRYQFGQYRNREYQKKEQYISFIQSCWRRKVPAFSSIQPMLHIEKFFYEFDEEKANITEHVCYNAPELDLVWMQVLSVASRIKELGGESLILYSGNRGYHLYVYLHEVIGFEANQETFARKFYKKMLMDVVNFDLYPNIDRRPTHINALSRIPFSYHQKTGNQIVPLNKDREVEFKALMFYREKHLPRNLTINIMADAFKDETSRDAIRSDAKYEGDWNIRKCIMTAMMLKPTHDAHLAFVMDALYAEDENQPLRQRDALIHKYISLYTDKYDSSKTQYFINKARESKERGIKPMACKTLQKAKICTHPNDDCDFRMSFRPLENIPSGWKIKKI